MCRVSRMRAAMKQLHCCFTPNPTISVAFAQIPSLSFVTKILALDKEIRPKDWVVCQSKQIGWGLVEKATNLKSDMSEAGDLANFIRWQQKKLPLETLLAQFIL